jgi:hypothetical protein
LHEDERTVVVYEAPTMALAMIVKDALTMGGIPVAEQVDAWSYGGAGFTFNNDKLQSFSRLYVPESRADEARSLIADFLEAYKKGELSLPEDSPDE